MKNITAGQVHKALVDSIELRWKPLANGAKYFDAPDCNLCDLFPDSKGYSRNPDDCKNCPLSMIGQCCVIEDSENYKSAWGKYYAVMWDSGGADIKAAKNMIVQLQKCLDTFFPAGLAKK